MATTASIRHHPLFSDPDTDPAARFQVSITYQTAERKNVVVYDRDFKGGIEWSGGAYRCDIVTFALAGTTDDLPGLVDAWRSHYYGNFGENRPLLVKSFALVRGFPGGGMLIERIRRFADQAHRPGVSSLIQALQQSCAYVSAYLRRGVLVEARQAENEIFAGTYWVVDGILSDGDRHETYVAGNCHGILRATVGSLTGPIWIIDGREPPVKLLKAGAEIIFCHPNLGLPWPGQAWCLASEYQERENLDELIERHNSSLDEQR